MISEYNNWTKIIIIKKFKGFYISKTSNIIIFGLDTH